MSGKCDGKNTCAVPASNSLFGDPCGGIYKYLVATWECTPSSPGESQTINVCADTKQTIIERRLYVILKLLHSINRVHTNILII